MRQDDNNEAVSVTLIYETSKVLLQDARNKQPSKTLLQRFYSKRANFKGRLMCPMEVS